MSDASPFAYPQRGDPLLHRLRRANVGAGRRAAQRLQQCDATIELAEMLSEDMREKAGKGRDLVRRFYHMQRRREPVRDLLRPIAVVSPRGLEECVKSHVFRCNVGSTRCWISSGRTIRHADFRVWPRHVLLALNPHDCIDGRPVFNNQPAAPSGEVTGVR